ncbi:MAG: fluoride efflux transporter CrcB [Steroidobacteraceae bacterium]
MPSFYSYLLVGIGSALGGMARHWTTGLVASRWGTAFPWGTLAVNVAGSLVIGVLAAGLVPGERWFLPLPARELLIVGLLGGYTTFSAFSLQTFMLLGQGAWLRAGGNVVLSIVLCLAAVSVGYLLATSVLRAG